MPGFGIETGNWAWHAFGQFATGLSYEYARSIAWASLQAQQILGPGSQDTGWMLAGRIAGDLLAIGSGANLISGGYGALGAGVIGCGTGVLCIVGAPAVAAGGGAVGPFVPAQTPTRGYTTVIFRLIPSKNSTTRELTSSGRPRCG